MLLRNISAATSGRIQIHNYIRAKKKSTGLRVFLSLDVILRLLQEIVYPTLAYRKHHEVSKQTPTTLHRVLGPKTIPPGSAQLAKSRRAQYGQQAAAKTKASLEHAQTREIPATDAQDEHGFLL